MAAVGDDAAISPYWLETLRLWREAPLRCRYGHYYFEFDNLGRWDCMQHAAEYAYLDRRWPCCGARNVASDGCVPADHTTRDYNFGRVHDIHVPSTRIMDQLLPGSGVVRGEGEDKNRIIRFDERAHDRLNPFDPDGYTLKHGR